MTSLCNGGCMNRYYDRKPSCQRDYKQFCGMKYPQPQPRYVRNVMSATKPYTQIKAHVVMDHETLEDIMKLYNMTLDDIFACNKTREIKLCPGKAILVYR